MSKISGTLLGPVYPLACSLARKSSGETGGELPKATLQKV